jgi:hypothetical protein
MQAKLLRCLGVCVLGGILVFAQRNGGQQRPRPADALKIEVTERLPPLPPPVEWERIIRDGDKIRLGDPNRSKELWEYSLIPLAPVRSWQEPTPTPEDKAPDIPRRESAYEGAPKMVPRGPNRPLPSDPSAGY